MNTAMILEPENKLPSDAIAYALNHSEAIPSEIGDVTSRTRISLSINTYYPEVAGGYYLNWRILAVIDQSILDAGLYMLHPDVLMGGHAKCFPVDKLVSSDVGEAYSVCQVDGTQCGQIMKWSFDAGGGGPFFSDNLIVDLFIEDEFRAPILNALAERCGREDVRLTQIDV